MFANYSSVESLYFCDQLIKFFNSGIRFWSSRREGGFGSSRSGIEHTPTSRLNGSHCKSLHCPPLFLKLLLCGSNIRTYLPESIFYIAPSSFFLSSSAEVSRTFHRVVTVIFKTILRFNTILVLGLLVIGFVLLSFLHHPLNFLLAGETSLVIGDGNLLVLLTTSGRFLTNRGRGDIKIPLALISKQTSICGCPRGITGDGVAVELSDDVFFLAGTVVFFYWYYSTNVVDSIRRTRVCTKPRCDKRITNNALSLNIESQRR